ncbi:hypothetical protein [Yinghuangia seranimata]|uniref:hypothetical protein n=1 Tax=Yinghuangia seranimata TaxID=408067 RepID=UPI00248C7434|nr:hypothetical protein [Yinghuangia seranimata]MDI2130986.1 hypothetical protein [Yinghuangia seranimata]
MSEQDTRRPRGLPLSAERARCAGWMGTRAECGGRTCATGFARHHAWLTAGPAPCTGCSRFAALWG